MRGGPTRMIGRSWTFRPYARAASAIAFTAGTDRVRWHFPTWLDVNDGSQKSQTTPIVLACRSSRMYAASLRPYSLALATE